MKNKFLLAAIGIIIILQIATLILQFGKDTKLGFQTADNADIDGTLNVDGATTLSTLTLTTGTVTTENVTTLNVSGLSDFDRITYGGVTTITSTSTNQNETLTAANICDAGLLQIKLPDADSGVGRFFLPTSSDLIADCLVSIGSQRTVLFWNAATTSHAYDFSQRSIASTTLQILTNGTSTDSTARPIIDSDGFAWFTFTNLDNTTTSVSILPLLHK